MKLVVLLLLVIAFAVEPKVTITISIPESIYLKQYNSTNNRTLQVLTDKVDVVFPDSGKL